MLQCLWKDYPIMATGVKSFNICFADWKVKWVLSFILSRFAVSNNVSFQCWIWHWNHNVRVRVCVCVDDMILLRGWLVLHLPMYCWGWGASNALPPCASSHDPDPDPDPYPTTLSHPMPPISSMESRVLKETVRQGFDCVRLGKEDNILSEIIN